MIAKNGSDAVFTTKSSGFDPLTGEVLTDVITSFTASAVRTKYSLKDIDGDNIRNEDFKLLVEATSGVPEKTMRVDFSGTIYTVVNVSPVSPSGIDVLYKVQVRV
jgi:hypothetical protein